MAIKKPIPITFNLDSRQSVQSVCAVIHIDDKNTETLDLSLMQGGEHIAVSPNSTVTARFVRVKDKILISDNVACTVQENGNIYIPIDNAAAHMLVGEIKIEINIVDENDILTMQFPLVIRVNNTILADAEISPESEGTIPELLEEAREAAESATQAAEAATEAISTKQDKLTAGENITIEGNVISAEGGVTDYNKLENKPQINGVELRGNKTTSDLNIETGTDDYEELDNLPKINGVKLFGNKYHHQLKLFGCLPVLNKVDRLETVLDLDGSKNAISSVAISRMGSFPLSMNPRYRKIIVSDYQNPNGDGLVDILFWQDDDSKQAKMAFRVSPTGKYDSGISSWKELTGGSQIVSGVVNVNGTITFTDSEGNSFTTSGESVIGADGFSPSATVQQTASGATITVTDKNGTTTANISNGQDGNDYVLTAQDKDDIADIVLSELPTTEGVLYGNQSN